MRDDWQSIASHVTRVTGEAFSPSAPRRVGGGCINRAVVLADERRRFFVKLNEPSLLPMFEAEADGLAEMAATGAIRVPRPLATGTTEAHAYLVMEHIGFGPGGDQSLAGRRLATMHRTCRERFGWDRDNTIGSTPQTNRTTENWALFWREQRLGFQLDLAATNGFGGRLQRQGEKLLEGVSALLEHAPQPSLLHGDLWGGNLGFDKTGSPVLFDPAVYYGDREADLAMTELFGGFSSDFYAAYREAWPVDSGYRVRKTLYNLYHILNHLNLFGGGYLDQAEQMIDRLLSELR
jgi:fructosamine-3-kinase